LLPDPPASGVYDLCVNARNAMPKGGTLDISAGNLVIDDSYAQMHLDAILVADDEWPSRRLHRRF
jgi:hypothetical protein